MEERLTQVESDGLNKARREGWEGGEIGELEGKGWVS